MTCLANSVSADVPDPADRPVILKIESKIDSKIDLIRERLTSGYYDRPEVIGEVVDRLAGIVREPIV